jgi:hypothetical protein
MSKNFDLVVRGIVLVRISAIDSAYISDDAS